MTGRIPTKVGEMRLLVPVEPTISSRWYTTRALDRRSAMRPVPQFCPLDG